MNREGRRRGMKRDGECGHLLLRYQRTCRWLTHSHVGLCCACIPPAVSRFVQSSHNVFAFMSLGFSHGAVGPSIFLTSGMWQAQIRPNCLIIQINSIIALNGVLRESL